MGETTRGRNDSGRKGKWAKRLRGERESGRNDPDSPEMVNLYILINTERVSKHSVSILGQRVVTPAGLEPG